MYIYTYIHIYICIHIRHRALVAREECLMPWVVPGRSGLNDFKGPTPPATGVACMTSRDFFGSNVRVFFRHRSLMDV